MVKGERWSKLWTANSVLYFSQSLSDKMHIRKEPAKFHTGPFNQVSNFKLVIALVVLEIGYDVWISDVDVVFKHDPWPLLAELTAGLQCSYVFQPNGPAEYMANTSTNEGNTGFHLLKARDSSISAIIEMSLRDDVRKHTDDQTHTWYVINNLLPHVFVSRRLVEAAHWRMAEFARDPQWPNFQGYHKDVAVNVPPLHLCPLPHDRFPCGHGRVQQVAKSDDAAVVHANFCFGIAGKSGKLRAYNAWWPRPQSEEFCLTNMSTSWTSS